MKEGMAMMPVAKGKTEPYLRFETTCHKTGNLGVSYQWSGSEDCTDLTEEKIAAVQYFAGSRIEKCASCIGVGCQTWELANASIDVVKNAFSNQ